MTFNQALQIVAERMADNKQLLRQQYTQRRNQVVDLYGVEYTRQGDGGSPAEFYISISPDMVYLERFEFKLIVQPFVSSVQGATQDYTGNTGNTSLSVSGGSISPNPHAHSMTHGHNIVSGVTLTHTTANDFRLSVDGVDITAYLMAQHGSWISGEGVYPSIDIEKNFDILEVASDLMASGYEAEAKAIVAPGYKKISISSDSPFQITLVNYLKYSHLNR